ncbi:alpha-hydroxy acid oxidase [Bosea sp. PAMC 26642]|uniref:alpha-hydroxy acid oxidase n=1 Tax=Bosea sp. (strain PAMC 26642) TaxID=1792307 RepID=UPI0007704249|nr:alpha-hydroxy acid oxidase [Bosea sp. PAMC 26642]AMJ61470.1 hypothetical protein AXW83_15230 [Bosea sp. PAMC 26642]
MPLPFADETRAALGEAVYAYLVGRARDAQPGEEDANERAFRRYRLLPRVMTGSGAPDLSVVLFGKAYGAPIVAGAYAGDTVFSEGGIAALAPVLNALRLPLLVSEEAVTPLKALTGVHDLCWLQLRAAGPLQRVLDLASSSAEAGIAALVLTVLAPVHPRPGLYPGGFSIGEELMRRELSTIGSAGAGIAALPAFPQWGWSDIAAVAMLCRERGLPLILKGILHPEDAVRARDAGAAAVVVSNIGLRQSSRWVTGLDQMPAIRDALQGGLPLLLDGGVRSGTDVLVACMAGASLAVVTRPLVAALASGGAPRARDLLLRWVDELAAMLAWMGSASLDGISADQLVPVTEAG